MTPAPDEENTDQAGGSQGQNKMSKPSSELEVSATIKYPNGESVIEKGGEKHRGTDEDSSSEIQLKGKDSDECNKKHEQIFQANQAGVDSPKSNSGSLPFSVDSTFDDTALPVDPSDDTKMIADQAHLKALADAEGVDGETITADIAQTPLECEPTKSDFLVGTDPAYASHFGNLALRGLLISPSSPYAEFCRKRYEETRDKRNARCQFLKEVIQYYTSQTGGRFLRRKCHVLPQVGRESRKLDVTSCGRCNRTCLNRGCVNLDDSNRALKPSKMCTCDCKFVEASQNEIFQRLRIFLRRAPPKNVDVIKSTPDLTGAKESKKEDFDDSKVDSTTEEKAAVLTSYPTSTISKRNNSVLPHKSEDAADASVKQCESLDHPKSTLYSSSVKEQKINVQKADLTHTKSTQPAQDPDSAIKQAMASRSTVHFSSMTKEALPSQSTFPSHRSVQLDKKHQGVNTNEMALPMVGIGEAMATTLRPGSPDSALVNEIGGSVAPSMQNERMAGESTQPFSLLTGKVVRVPTLSDNPDADFVKNLMRSKPAAQQIDLNMGVRNDSTDDKPPARLVPVHGTMKQGTASPFVAQGSTTNLGTNVTNNHFNYIDGLNSAQVGGLIGINLNLSTRDNLTKDKDGDHSNTKKLLSELQRQNTALAHYIERQRQESQLLQSQFLVSQQQQQLNFMVYSAACQSLMKNGSYHSNQPQKQQQQQSQRQRQQQQQFTQQLDPSEDTSSTQLLSMFDRAPDEFSQGLYQSQCGTIAQVVAVPQIPQQNSPSQKNVRALQVLATNPKPSTQQQYPTAVLEQQRRGVDVNSDNTRTKNSVREDSLHCSQQTVPSMKKSSKIKILRPILARTLSGELVWIDPTSLPRDLFSNDALSSEKGTADLDSKPRMSVPSIPTPPPLRATESSRLLSSPPLSREAMSPDLAAILARNESLTRKLQRKLVRIQIHGSETPTNRKRQAVARATTDLDSRSQSTLGCEGAANDNTHLPSSVAAFPDNSVSQSNDLASDEDQEQSLVLSDQPADAISPHPKKKPRRYKHEDVTRLSKEDYARKMARRLMDIS